MMSPSGGFWFDRATLETDALAVYAPAARRVYSSMQMAAGHELSDLLRILRQEPIAGALAAHVESVHSALASWSVRHGMTLSLWERGEPTVRATARHPTGGVGCVEYLTGTSTHAEVFVHHWVDDWTRALRRSHSVRLREGPFADTDLLQTFDEAIRHLLELPGETTYSQSALPGDAVHADRDAQYWSSFSTLR